MKTLTMKNLNKSVILTVLLALPLFIFAGGPTEITPSGTIESSGGVLIEPDGEEINFSGSPIPIRYTGDVNKQNINSNFKFNLKVGEKKTLSVSKFIVIDVTLNSLTNNKAKVTVFFAGGCGPNADPRCLGAPAFEETFDLKLGEPKRIPGTGMSLTFAQKISDDEMMFILTTFEGRIIPMPTPPPPEPPTPTPTHTPTHTPTPHMSTISSVKLDFVTEVREIESGSYEIKGRQKGRLLFLLPVEIDVSYSLTDNAVTNVKRPWWSILVWVRQ